MRNFYINFYYKFSPYCLDTECSFSSALYYLFLIRCQTDGKWCYLLFWVVGTPTRWSLLKNRLVEVCPTCTPAASGIYYYRPEFQQPRPSDVFLLKFWCSYDWKGLLHGKPLYFSNFEWQISAKDGTSSARIIQVNCYMSVGKKTNLLVTRVTFYNSKGWNNSA